MLVYMISFPNLVLVMCCLVVHTILHRGLQARVVLVASHVYRHDPPQWWAQGCLYDNSDLVCGGCMMTMPTQNFFSCMPITDSGRTIL
jgi:hypothetical protein